jgi:hypothetical protein
MHDRRLHGPDRMTLWCGMETADKANTPAELSGGPTEANMSLLALNQTCRVL